MRFKFILLISILFAAGCNDDDKFSDILSEPIPPSTVTALFSPSDAIIPFPNNLLFQGSQDGTLNIPVTDPTNTSDPTLALNELDGFSTVTPWSTNFSNSLDQSSLVPGRSIRVFEVTTSTQGAVTGIISEFTDYVVSLADNNGSLSTLIIVPTRPLKAKTTYMAILTNDILDILGGKAIADVVYGFTKQTTSLLTEQGASIFSPLSDEQAQILEPLRLLTGSMLVAAASQGITSDSVVLSWIATTQSINDVLFQVRNQTIARAATLQTLGVTTQAFGLSGLVDIYTGTLDVPYYLDASNILQGHWNGADNTALTKFNPIPIEKSVQTIPLLITLPNNSIKPSNGWPVAIFQHGITRNRLDLLAIADTLAQAGYAGIAIDIPLHGVTDTSLPFHAVNTPVTNDTERHFAVDFLNNDTGAPGPDGIVDESGAHFINLASLLTSRDNLRQGASDLLTLAASIDNISLDNADLFDGQSIGFIGHSLGGIIGSTFLAFQSNINSATLAMPGGGIAKLVGNSPTFSPRINAGLAAQGLQPGTADYEQFFLATQTVIDSGDPINYTVASRANTPIHLIEIIGGSGALPDQVIPNFAADAPLSGTEPLIRELGLQTISTTTQSSVIHAVVRFTAGDHGSIVNPQSNLAVTIEIQTEIASFLQSKGTTLVISDSTHIQ